MAFTKAQALEAVNTVLTSQRLTEKTRLNRIHQALQPNLDFASYTATTITIPDDAPPLMRELARKSETNYLPLLVKTFSQVMKADGYQTVESPGETDPWVWWQRNRMDSRQAGLTRSALSYGAAYATVLPGTYGRGEAGPAIALYSPRKLTALYQDPESDEWPMMAVSVDEQGDRTAIVSLYDEEFVYRFGVDYPTGSFLPIAGLSMAYGPGRLTYIDQLEHGVGVTPVIRYRDRNLLAGEESMGIVEPLMTLQERINETTFQMSVTQYFQAFKQRYVLGWVPESDEQELKASAARIWYMDKDPEDIKIGELPGGDVEPYINSRNSAIRDFAAIGQIPAQALGIDGISNISDATLAGLEAAKNRESGEIMTSLGESHEQMLRLCAQIDGNESAADDYNSEIRWRNFEARSFAQTVDGLGKLATMLGIPAEALLEDVPGFTGQRLERVTEELRRSAATSRIKALVSASNGAVNGGDNAASGGVPASEPDSGQTGAI